MSYITTVNNQTYTVDTGENGRSHNVTIEGNEHSIDWRQIAALVADAKGNVSNGGRYSLLLGGKSYEVFACRLPKSGEDGSQAYEIQFAGQRFEVRVEDEREKALAGSVKPVHTGEARVYAPMPGLVIGVAVEMGASVTLGQTVVVLEAMKMENDLAAPRAGTIKEIKVSKGQTVNQGDVLVVIS